MRLRWIALSLGGLVIVVLFAFPLWWPALNRRVEEEAFPGLSQLSAEERAAIQAIALENRALAQACIDAALAGPVVVPEADQAMPLMQGPTVYAVGEFTTIDAVRRASGEVTLYQQADGSWVLRFEDFEAHSGPQLHVFLSAHPQPRTPEQLREQALGLDLGPLQGTVGAQNYLLPAEIDMSFVRSVVIYSVSYQTVFSSAQLIPQ